VKPSTLAKRCISIALGVVVTTHGTTQCFAAGSSSLSVAYRSWTISSPAGDVVVSQFVAPISATIQVRPNLDMVVTDAAASSNADGGGIESDLGGMTSLSGQVFLRVADDRVQLQLGVTAPSGKRGIDSTETSVMRLLGLPVLQFGLRHYGRGSEVNLGCTAAFPRSPTLVASLGVGYIARGEYELFRDAEDYKPASELAVNAGVDIGDPDPESRGPLWRADVTMRFFGTDRLGGEDAFDEANRLEIGVRALTRGEGIQWNGSLRVEINGTNIHHSTSGLLDPIEAASGDAYFFRGGASMPMSQAWRAGVRVEWNQVRGSDEFGNDGYSYALGPTLSRDGRSLGFQVGATYLGGKLDGFSGSDDRDLGGFASDASVHWLWGY
jgi:hypothetical protein